MKEWPKHKHNRAWRKMLAHRILSNPANKHDRKFVKSMVRRKVYRADKVRVYRLWRDRRDWLRAQEKERRRRELMSLVRLHYSLVPPIIEPRHILIATTT